MILQRRIARTKITEQNETSMTIENKCCHKDVKKMRKRTPDQFSSLKDNLTFRVTLVRSSSLCSRKREKFTICSPRGVCSNTLSKNASGMWIRDPPVAFHCLSNSRVSVSFVCESNVGFCTMAFTKICKLFRTCEGCNFTESRSSPPKKRKRKKNLNSKSGKLKPLIRGSFHKIQSPKLQEGKRQGTKERRKKKAKSLSCNSYTSSPRFCLRRISVILGTI